MNATIRKQWMGWLAACALAVLPAAAMADTMATMSEDDYEAAEERIASEARAEHKACKRLDGHARDICRLQARGKEKTAKARLAAEYQPGPEADRALKEAEADAELALARKRCGELKDKARKKCIQQAEHKHEAAIRLAKVEKVRAINEIKARAAREEKAAAKAAGQGKPAGEQG